MALQVSQKTTSHREDVVGRAAMEGNDELEEGEACEANDSNYGPDLNFPHLELKLTEVLGHIRKDFEGGVYAEKLGSKFGGYGTFLPTEVRGPSIPTAQPKQVPAAPSTANSWGRRSPPTKQLAPTSNNPGNLEAMRRPPITDTARGSLDRSPHDNGNKPSTQSKMLADSGEVKKTSSITLRIKMGSERVVRGKNTAIYNGLGFSSPSLSEEDDGEEMSGAESSPDRSPASMIQIILSHGHPPDGLLSPLPDLVSKQAEKSLKTSGNGFCKEEFVKERKHAKSAKKEKDDGGRKDMELDCKQIKHENESRVRKDRSKSRVDELQEDAMKNIRTDMHVSSEETLKTSGRAQDASKGSEFAIEAGKHLVRREPRWDANHMKDTKNHDSSVNILKEGSLVKNTVKTRRDEVSSIDIFDLKERGAEAHADKRKLQDTDSRLKKKHKSNSSTGSIETEAPKEKKKSRKHSVSVVAESNLPTAPANPAGKPKDVQYKKKDRSGKVAYSKVAPELYDSTTRDQREILKDDRKGFLDDVVAGAIKVKGGKTKTSKRNNKVLGDHPGREPTDANNSDMKVSEPYLQPQVATVAPLNSEIVAPPPVTLIEEHWVECDKCRQWRLLPPNMDPDKLSDKWLCKMITWLPPGMNECRFTEEETTNAVYQSLGIVNPNYPPVDPSAVPSAPVPVPSVSASAEFDFKSNVLSKPSNNKKGSKSAGADGLYSAETLGKSRTTDAKPGKQKRKEKSKQPHTLEGFTHQSNKGSKDRDRDIGVEAKPMLEKSTKKKKPLAEESHPSKKMKIDEGNSSQRGKVSQAEMSNENNADDNNEDGESYNRGVLSRKATSKAYDEAKVSKREKHAALDDGRKMEKRAQEVEGSHRTRMEDPEREEAGRVFENASNPLLKTSKCFKPEKSMKGKTIRVVTSGDEYRHSDILDERGGRAGDSKFAENRTQALVRVNDDGPHSNGTEQKRRKTLGNRSPQVSSPCDSSDGFKGRLPHMESDAVAIEARSTEGTESIDKDGRKGLARCQLVTYAYDKDSHQRKVSERHSDDYIEHDHFFRTKWEEGEDNVHHDESSWDDQQDAGGTSAHPKQLHRQKSWELDASIDRYRDGNDQHQDRDRDFESGKWGRRLNEGNIPDDRGRPSNQNVFREEKHSARHSRRAEGRSHHESDDNKPKVRLKNMDGAGKFEQEEQEHLCKFDKGENLYRRDGKGDTERSTGRMASDTLVSNDRRLVADKENRMDVQKLTAEGTLENSDEAREGFKPSRDHRKGVVDYSEGEQDGGSIERKDLANASSLANNAIKAATNLKHTADRLKDETATDIYLQAALKFLQGAALMESVQLYNDTAQLFRYCAVQYERAKDMPGAVLAYKCAAVARFRLLLVKNASMNKDRADLQAAFPRVPAVTLPTGESPSSSSASDLDNLNSQVITVEKMPSSSGKGAISPLVQGSGSNSCLIPSALQPTLIRLLQNTSEVFEAFENWNKADSVLAAVVAAKVLSSEKMNAVEKVGSIGFSDVEALVRLVNQALEALGR